MPNKALITGISGQDGSYLAEFLLAQGYEVHGLVLPVELENPKRDLWRLSGIIDKIKLYPSAIESYASLLSIVGGIKPNECYHLAAQSFVSYTIDNESSIYNTNILGTHYILSVIRQVAPDCRFYFAGSSELFGRAKTSPQDETTPFNPRSIYGITKLTGYYLTCNFREKFNIFACNGILYNHESPRRGEGFVTQKITSGVSKIKVGKEKSLSLGNLDARRDWGYAPEYVSAMWKMLQQDKPDDYVLATGQLHSVRELCAIAFSYVGLEYRDYIKIDQNFFRSSEKIPLVGNPKKAGRILGWKPQKDFKEMIEEMVEADIRANRATD
jgi:GDPmannose 4,6-dehydratase